MSTNNATRFFDTTGCLNLARPSSVTRKIASAKQPKRNVNPTVPIRGQIKIDLYNFDHIDFADSKYVLTSPRSLEACARLNIKPTTLLPRTLSDIQTNQVRYSTLVDVYDEMERERLEKLKLCREEREKVTQAEALPKQPTAKEVDPKSSHVDNRPLSHRIHKQIRFKQPNGDSFRSVHNSESNDKLCATNDVNYRRPPRSSSATRAMATSAMAKPSTYIQWSTTDNQNGLRTSSSASFLDDVRRMDQDVQRIGTSKPEKSNKYINGLENVKQVIQQHATQTMPDNDLDNLKYEKNSYDLLLSHYDHELKLQKARENARRTEQEKETERYESLMHDFVGQTLAEERRQSELQRKMDKRHHSRQLYEALQAKNHELQMADVQKRRTDLLKEIKRKDRRTEDFVKDKQEAANLFRILAKSSQDTREYIRETKESFDQKARKAELASSVLVTKPKVPINRRHLQTTAQT